jgi:phenylpyruvate tautomerase PptA (4-oxalocrotonate tautomerase family)
MPQVRIDLLKGKSAQYRRKVGQVVYEALIGIGVPKDDRFQVIVEHDRDSFVYDPHYLGIERTDDLIMIQITLNEGRTLEQKRALFKSIADGLYDAIGLRRQDACIDLVEVKRENWSFGDGVAQYAPPD